MLFEVQILSIETLHGAALGFCLFWIGKDVRDLYVNFCIPQFIYCWSIDVVFLYNFPIYVLLSYYIIVLLRVAAKKVLF